MVGPAACHSKARRVERKLGFIPDAGKWWGRWRTPVQRPILHPGPPDQLGMRAFTESGEGYMQKEHRHLPQSSPQLVISGRTRVICVVCGASVARLASSALSAGRAVFSSGCSCSHFFAVSSQNCGGSSAGYSLLIQHFTSLPGVSVSVRAHRRWLRMLSTALEKELRVLDYA